MDGSKENRKDGWEKGIVFRRKERNIVKRNIRKEKGDTLRQKRYYVEERKRL